MPTKRTQINRAYNEKNYDRISVTVPKGFKKDIEKHAKTKCRSVNGLINELILKDMGMMSITKGDKSDKISRHYRETIREIDSD